MSLTPSTLAAFAADLGNHLWQSTLFTGAVALLTCLFRKNHATVRYWMWLTASLKFLVPFSWLIVIGNRISWTMSKSSPRSL